MTEEQARHLMAVVRRRLRQVGITADAYPEHDDMLAEGYWHAWRAVERMPADSPYSWKTIAGREAILAARKYLGRRASGRMRTQQLGTPAYEAAHNQGRALTAADREAHRAALPLSSLSEAEWLSLEPAWDGGFPAADARLQLWVVSPPLTEAQQEILDLIYRDGLSTSEASRRLGIANASAVARHKSALNRYRRRLFRAAP